MLRFRLLPLSRLRLLLLCCSRGRVRRLAGLICGRLLLLSSRLLRLWRLLVLLLLLAAVSSRLLAC